MLDIVPSSTTPVFHFDQDDEVVIDGTVFRPFQRSANGYIFQKIDGDKLPVEFSDEALAAWVARGDLVHNRGKFDPAHLSSPSQAPTDALSLIDGPAAEMLNIRRAFVMAFFDLSQGPEKKIYRTEAALEAAMYKLQKTASTYFEQKGQRSYVGGLSRLLDPVSPKSLLRWIRKYEKEGLAGLLDARVKRGNRQRRMTPEELILLGKLTRGYLSRQGPTIAQIHKKVRDEFKQANKEREAQGLPLFKIPSRETVRQEIGKFDPFHVMLAREGKQAALRKFQPVGMGLQLTRPLEEVQMDEWMIDLMSIMISSGLYDLLSDEERLALGLDDKKARWWVSVAICCTTRCILGLRLMRAPSTDAALETVEMALSDKGIFCDAVAARTPWNMHGHIEHLVTDCGSAFKSFEFAKAMADLGISFELAPAGIPQLRGTIERLFQTFIMQLIPMLSGRTFSDLATRSEYNSEKNAVLTADELAFALVRYVVDIYHNSPHAGLGGATPFNCWQKLAASGTLRPAPGQKKRRIVFGTTRERTIQKAGIRILNVWYHSRELAAWVAATGEKEVQVRWHNKDIGEIDVLFGGQWQTVKATLAGFAGVEAQTWVAAARQLRAANREAAEWAEDIVFAAIRDIEKMNDNAIKRGGLITDTWDDARLLEYDEKLFIGFNVAGSTAAKPEAQGGNWGRAIEPGAPVDPASPVQPIGEVPVHETADPEEDDVWGFDDE